MARECVGSSGRMGWFGVAFVSKVLFDRVSVFTIQFAICASRILDQRMMFLTRWEQVLSAYGCQSCNKQPRLELKTVLSAQLSLHFSTARKIGTNTKPIIQSLPLFPQLQEVQIEQWVSAIILYTCPLPKSFSYVLALLYKLSKHLS